MKGKQFNWAKVFNDDARITPLIQAYFHDRKLPMTVEFKPRHALDYGPDGWFHPSTHPLMGQRKLWLYLNEPDRWVKEVMAFSSVFSVAFGSTAHRLIQNGLFDMGVSIAPEIDGPEPMYEHSETRARGELDGILKLDPPLAVPERPTLVGLDIKTRTAKANDPDTLDNLAWIRKFPTYYAQVQEYMRITGLRAYVVVFMYWGYPWEFKEWHIVYDPEFAQRISEKYLAVIQADEMPFPCCDKGSSESKLCEARKVCPNGT